MKRKMLFMVAAIALLVAACSTDSKTVVPKKPVITVNPQDDMPYQGDAAAPLTVTATTKDKKAKLSYQWYINTENSNKKGAKVADAAGALTSGVEGGEFTPSTDTVGEFYYYVEVTSTLGKEKAKTTSKVATITVLDKADKIEDNTKDGEMTTEQGEDVLLNVKLPQSIEELLASEEGEDYEVSYQWYNNGTRNSNSGGVAIEGANESSYLPPTDVEGTTYYYVVVTVKDKTTGDVVKTIPSSPMKVTVVINTTIIDPTKENARKPLIREQPASSPPYYLGVPASAPLTVTATVSDDGILTYQWFRNTEDDNEGGERINGARSASYTPPTTEAGIWYYYVVITNTIEDNLDGGQKTAQATSEPVQVEVERGINAQTPNITIQPINTTYTVTEAKPTALSVTATLNTALPGAGTLSYQWYKRTTEFGPEDPIDGATERTYVPSTDTKGVIFFSVVVTNTIDDNGDGGFKRASVESDTIYVAVAVKVITLVVPDLSKVYDGSTAVTATWLTTGTTFTFTPATTLSGASLVKGTAVFAQADAGTNIPIILDNWVLSGSNAGDYLLRLPSPTATISKAEGAAVASVPTVKGSPTGNTIEVNVVELATAATDMQKAQQSVEYAIYTTNNRPAANLDWQADPTFTGLNAKTNYYVYARSTQTTNYNAGTERVSSAIQTGDPLVIFEVNGGTNLGSSTVIRGSKLAQPVYNATTREGYTFDFWYTDAALATPYNFEEVINNNLTLYAKWVSNNVIAEMSSKDLVWVKGGAFTMGSPTNQTGRINSWTNAKVEDEHRVVLSGFWMGKYEVTQEKWQGIMGSNPSSNQTGVEIGTPQKLPVTNVSWYDALVFCNKLSADEDLQPVYSIQGNTNPILWGNVPTADSAIWNTVTMVSGANGYRLPTEAQWEFACRAGTAGAYNGSLDDVAWYSSNSNSTTHHVGKKAPNAWGLYDMHGNVQEWCWDYFGYLPNPIPAVMINPINTKSDQTWSTRTRTYDPQHDPTSWYYSPVQHPSGGTYNGNKFVSSSVNNTYVSACMYSIPGSNRPGTPYVRRLESKTYQIGVQYQQSDTGNSYTTTRFYGYYYDKWVTATSSPIRDARVVRGGRYNTAEAYLRSACRTNDNLTTYYSNVAGDITEYQSTTSNYPNIGLANSSSWTRNAYVGLRLVRP